MIITLEQLTKSELSEFVRYLGISKKDGSTINTYKWNKSKIIDLIRYFNEEAHVIQVYNEIVK